MTLKTLGHYDLDDDGHLFIVDLNRALQARADQQLGAAVTEARHRANAFAIGVLLIDGYQPHEIRQQLGLSREGYDQAHARLAECVASMRDS